MNIVACARNFPLVANSSGVSSAKDGKNSKYGGLIEKSLQKKQTDMSI